MITGIAAPNHYSDYKDAIEKLARISFDASLF
jgi:hypothetical protein